MAPRLSAGGLPSHVQEGAEWGFHVWPLQPWEKDQAPAAVGKGPGSSGFEERLRPTGEATRQPTGQQRPFLNDWSHWWEKPCELSALRSMLVGLGT